MRQQTKPSIVERKPSRKPKLDASKTSIWEGLVLTSHKVSRSSGYGPRGRHRW